MKAAGILFPLLLLVCLKLQAQQISDVTAVLQGNEIMVSARMLNAEKNAVYSVELWYSINQAAFRPCKTARCVSGDCSKIRPADDLRIVWPVLEELSGLAAESLQFEVRAVRVPELKSGSFTEKFGIDMIYVPGGTFVMGPGKGESRFEEYYPNREVTLSAYYMSKTEITQKQWRDVMGSDPPELSHKGCDQCPVEGVSWPDVQDFLKKLSALTGKTYTLPTEAQWEYACRAGTSTRFNTGDCLSDAQANYNCDAAFENCPAGRSRWESSPVGSYPPNAWGFYDMHGNVIEWCSDWFEYYRQGAQTDPPGPESGQGRVGRGGSWGFGQDECQSAWRNGFIPTKRHECLGFRIVLKP